MIESLKSNVHGRLEAECAYHTTPYHTMHGRLEAEWMGLRKQSGSKPSGLIFAKLCAVDRPEEAIVNHKIINQIGFRLLYAPGFETCFGLDPWHQRCLDPIRPRQVSYHELMLTSVEQRVLVHDRALVLGIWIAKHTSNSDVAWKPF